MPYADTITKLEVEEWVKIKAEVATMNLRRGAGLFYGIQSMTSITGSVACVIALFFVDLSFWGKVADVSILACLLIQLAFIGHAGGHRQISEIPWVNDVIGVVFTPFVGISQSMWRYEHNKHHSFPNDTAIDLAPRLPLFSLSVEQFLARPLIIRLITRFQFIYFWPACAVETWGLHVTSLIYLNKHRDERLSKYEFWAILAYWVLFISVFITALGVVEGLTFFLIHKLILGFYMGMVFAPNHKGMEIIEEKDKVSFIARQLRTTRNAGFGGIVATILFGGLNLQAEHHLFPRVPYPQLIAVRKVVKRHLEPLQDTFNLPYHEVSVPRSYWELLVHLFKVSWTKKSGAVA